MADRTGIRVRHQRSCASRAGAGCNCRPSYQAQVFDAVSGRQIWRTARTITEAKLWRADTQAQARRGILQRPVRTTVREAAQTLMAGMDDGSILDRSGKPYKPSATRAYSQTLRSYVLPTLGSRRLDEVHRADIQDLVEGLRRRGLAPSTIHNVLDPLRVLFRRAVRRDEVLIDPTRGLELPAVRGQRDRIESPENARKLLEALPDDERALWTVAMFAGLRRGELLALRWVDIDFDGGVIRVERGWDMYAGEIAAKSKAGVRAVPMAFPVHRELRELKRRSRRDGDDLVFGRTSRDPFFPSTVRARAMKAWKAAGVDPITLHEARHCAVSFFIASGLDLKQVSTWAGHSDIRTTLNRYGHVIPGSERDAADRLTAYLAGPTVARTVAHPGDSAESPAVAGLDEYRYRDSNPGFRRERAAS
jgi:integrase